MLSTKVTLTAIHKGTRDRNGATGMLESRIYVGLNDKDTREQHYNTEKYKEMLKEICKDYRAPFSVTVMEGGYFHDDGSWVGENSLLITLLGVPKKTVYEIANDVCKAFHQESVIITCSNIIDFVVVSDKLTKADRLRLKIQSLIDF